LRIFVLDLKDKSNCVVGLRARMVVFQLAADMGGMGFIENNKGGCACSLCSRNAHVDGCEGDWREPLSSFSSSACVLYGEKADEPRTWWR